MQSPRFDIGPTCIGLWRFCWDSKQYRAAQWFWLMTWILL